MKKLLLKLFSCLLVAAPGLGQNLVPLETYLPDSHYMLTDWYSTFSMAIAPSGDVIGLYGLNSYGEASYIARQYPQGEPARTHYIGGYNGNGGTYYPVICGLEDQRMLVQITGFGDLVEPYDTHGLISVDLTNNDHINRHFYTKQSQVKGVWKTDSSHVCSFFNSWNIGTVDVFYFIKQIDLFEEYADQYDSNFVVNGDTLLAIPSVSSYTQKKLRSSQTYLSIYDLNGSENWSSVCVTLDSVVAQIDSIFPKSSTMPHLYSTEDTFMALLRSPLGGSINLWTYTPSSGETSNELVYTPPEGSLEYLGHYESTILADEIVLQIPILRDIGSYDVDNWSSLIIKRISRGDYSVLAADTIFVFEPQTDIIRHQIDDDGINTHSLIATRTPEYSRISYYGINDLVDIKEEPRYRPEELVIRDVFPNPFNHEIRIELSASVQVANISLQVFDLRGRLVWSKQNLHGRSFIWNGQDFRGQGLNSGVYLLILSKGSAQDSRKILMLK